MELHTLIYYSNYITLSIHIPLKQKYTVLSLRSQVCTSCCRRSNGAQNYEKDRLCKTVLLPSVERILLHEAVVHFVEVLVGAALDFAQLAVHIHCVTFGFYDAACNIGAMVADTLKIAQNIIKYEALLD